MLAWFWNRLDCKCTYHPEVTPVVNVVPGAGKGVGSSLLGDEEALEEQGGLGREEGGVVRQGQVLRAGRPVGGAEGEGLQRAGPVDRQALEGRRRVAARARVGVVRVRVLAVGDAVGRNGRGLGVRGQRRRGGGGRGLGDGVSLGVSGGLGAVKQGQPCTFVIDRSGYTHAVAVGVKVLVEVAVTVPGAKVLVKVVVVDGVGMDRQEHAVDTTAEAQVVGIQVGFDTEALPRLFRIVPTGVEAV